MQTRFLTYRSSIIHIACHTGGALPVICFHGFGEDCLAFSFLENCLPPVYSIFAIDLPFHGKTQWNEGRDFTGNDLLMIVEEILAGLPLINETPDKPKPAITLLGFSLGGRMALSLYEKAPERFSKIILLAPDGLKVNPWYWLATQTRIGNRLFKLTMQKPGWFLGLLKLANKLGLVNSSIFKFVTYYIGDPEVRRLLYLRWTTLRQCRPNLMNIRKRILNQKTQVRLIYGRHDRIILPAPGDRFRKGVEDLCHIRIIESGHQLLQVKYASLITEEILD